MCISFGIALEPSILWRYKADGRRAGPNVYVIIFGKALPAESMNIRRLFQCRPDFWKISEKCS